MSHLSDIAILASVLSDAPYKLLDALGDGGYDIYRSLGEPEWMAWPQAWSDTSCGFGGIGGQSVTVAQTIVVFSDGYLYAVYHAGRFAYTVKNPTDTFILDLTQHSLCGKIDSVRSKYERVRDQHE